jgi:uncharacterized protein YegP (UPF0339 family)
MHFIVYEASDGWRWRLFARNGKVIADSGQAYSRRIDCIRLCGRINAVFPVTVEYE